MMRVEDLVAAISALQRSDLETWIREELVVPRQEAGALLFTDMECARIRLICTLHYELEIDADTLPVMLSLVDQLYDTRRRLFSLTAAVAAQDKDIQAAIIAAMAPKGGASGADFAIPVILLSQRPTPPSLRSGQNRYRRDACPLNLEVNEQVISHAQTISERRFSSEA